MTVSMHLHDCAVKEKQRAALAAQIAEYERKNGRVKTIPPQRREPDTRVDLVINAKSHDTGKKADGKHNERNAARLSIPVVKPDHAHPITAIMLNHAFRKLGVTKKDAAQAMRVSPSCISNICNSKQQVSDERMREILACVWRLSVERDAA